MATTKTFTKYYLEADVQKIISKLPLNQLIESFKIISGTIRFYEAFTPKQIALVALIKVHPKNDSIPSRCYYLRQYLKEIKFNLESKFDPKDFQVLSTDPEFL